MSTLARLSLSTVALSLGLAAAASNAVADPVYTETTVHDTTTNVEVELNANTVLCSSADYGALYLKILIPQLARLTLLDHQNLGAGAPCVAAGMCEPGNEPSDIIDPSDPKDTVAINVKAIRVDEADADTQTCNTSLTEKVKVTIRGVDFFHERWATLGTRPYSDCVSTPVVDPDPTGEGTGSGSGSGSGEGEGEGEGEQGKPDRPSVEEPNGGCSATGTGSFGSLLFALGLVGRRRRRR
jgi:uncharacterized protein (TIGR03382 family)